MKVNVLRTGRGTYIMEIIEDIQPIAIFNMESAADPVKRIKNAISILKTDREAWKKWEGIIDPIAWTKWRRYMREEDKTLLNMWMEINFDETNRCMYWEYINPTINEMIRESRKSQKEFANYFGIPLGTVHNWCQGIANCPAYTLEMMHKILKYENIMKDYCGIHDFEPEN